MSAPHEVYVNHDPDEYPWDAGMEPEPGTVRYLRADLTCGECLFSDNPASWCIKRGIPVRTDSPACMAIRPRPAR
jgi:hypothetical protein